jgi:hypothetical protein
MEFDNEGEEEELNIDDIKKIVNSKRNNTPKKYSKEDELKNLELAREKRKSISLNKTTMPLPIPTSIPAPIPAPIPTSISASIPDLIPASIPTPIPAPIFSIENNLINGLRNMILKQNKILEKIIPEKEEKELGRRLPEGFG